MEAVLGFCLGVKQKALKYLEEEKSSKVDFRNYYFYGLVEWKGFSSVPLTVEAASGSFD